jgi:DNA transposition AAA+ family ATPase
MKNKFKRLQIIGDNPPYDEQLRLWLEGHIAEHPHLTTAILSRPDKIGMSKTALDAYLAGRYFMPTKYSPNGLRSSKIETLIRAYRERVEGTVRHGFNNTFIETRSWNQFQHACHTAITENVIVVVYGKPGTGKSRCLLEYSIKKMTTGAIIILCSTNITPRYFARKLARTLGLDDRPPTAELEDIIAEKLRRTPRPIFVDQANYLNEKSLGTLCYIWEIAKVPIILFGTKDLYELFMTSRLTEDVRAQLSSRVAMHYPLMELSLEEVKGIVQRALKEDATEEAIAQIYSVTGGIHRHVDMIIPRFNELKQINREELEQGKIMLSDLINTAGRRLLAG